MLLLPSAAARLVYTNNKDKLSIVGAIDPKRDNEISSYLKEYNVGMLKLPHYTRFRQEVGSRLVAGSGLQGLDGNPAILKRYQWQS